ncbi:MAG: glycosyltransferase family 2 protein, partial [Acidimicrobiales bacterium]
MILRPAIVVLGWLAGTWLLWSIPRVRAAAYGTVEAVEAVSVVIPARDEAATLPGLLASLAGQHPAPAEILVVDDHSTDDGAEVARRAGATVVPAPPLPAGWTGKCWACWTGARAAGGSVLVFLDADTELDPGGLAPIVAEQAGRGGLVSVQPFHRTRRPYEALSAFLNIVPWMGLAAATPTAARRWSPGAFGPCLVTTRADYRAIGGHEAVRGEVVEDVALAARYRAAGLPVATLGGRGTISFRMYPGGVSQLVEGWTK